MLYETLFSAWFVFYLMGIDCRNGKFDNLIQKVNGWWIIVSLGLSFVEAFILLEIGCSTGFASSQIKFSSFVYSAFIALWLMKSVKECGRSILSTIGDCSFAIYFSHMLIESVVREVLIMLGIQAWIANWFFTFVFTAVISFIFALVVRKTLKEKKVLRYIGFV